MDQPWSRHGLAALAWTARRPALLCALVLLLNAVARPYAGMVHDARIYALQVLNQVEPGAYADDLFLRFGSQDRFSIFSRLAAPLAGLLGVDASFFLLYLLSNTLFLIALVRLVRAWLGPRAVTTLALAYLACMRLPYGGLNIFTVHEPFLTPRLMTEALVLFALERQFRGHLLAALGLLAGAMALHPLMGLGGILVAAAYGAMHLPRPALLLLLLLCTAAGAACVHAFGERLFGVMDPNWADTVLAASNYNFPLEWNVLDLIHYGFLIALPLFAAFGPFAHDGRRQKLLLALGLCGAVGLLGTFLGAAHGYALLLQGQPYRVGWVLKIAHVSFGFALVRYNLRWPHPFSQLAAVFLSLVFSLTAQLPVEVALVGFLALVTLPACRGLEMRPRWADWPRRGMLWAIGLAGCLWTLYAWTLLVMYHDRLVYRMDASDYVKRFVENASPVGWGLAAAWLARLAWARPGRARGLALGGLAAALLLQAAAFAVDRLEMSRPEAQRNGADLQFLQAYLARVGPAHPTVYCDLGRADFLWMHCRCKCYFDWSQIVGVVFSRQTAAEGHRRAWRVRAFELHTLARDLDLMPDEWKRSYRRLYGADLDGRLPPPSRADLLALCQEPGLDYVAVQHAFAGLPCASNGSIYVYDCQQVRQAAGIPPASASALY